MALKLINDLVPSINQEQPIAAVYSACTIFKEKASTLDLAQISSHAINYMSSNPVQTGIYATGAVLSFAPGVLTAPVLGVIGFTAEGVAAGSVAATIQSTLGPIAANSGFAIFQSAGAAGAGTQIVNGAVQGVAFAGSVLNIGGEALRKRWYGV